MHEQVNFIKRLTLSETVKYSQVSTFLTIKESASGNCNLIITVKYAQIFPHICSWVFCIVICFPDEVGCVLIQKTRKNGSSTSVFGSFSLFCHWIDFIRTWAVSQTAGLYDSLKLKVCKIHIWSMSPWLRLDRNTSSVLTKYIFF